MILRHILKHQDLHQQARWFLYFGQLSFLIGILLPRLGENAITAISSGILIGASIVLHITYLYLWRGSQKRGDR